MCVRAKLHISIHNLAITAAMKILIAAITAVLVQLISSATANTLILSNQKESGRLGCIKCIANLKPRIATCIEPGNEISFKLPANATDSTGTLCVGTYDQVSHGYRDEKLYFVYDSSRDFEKFKNKIVVKVNDTGFHRSNEEKKVWEQIYPKMRRP